MKTKVVLTGLFSLLCLVFAGDLAAQKEQKTETVYFFVEELNCKNCQARVEKSISFEKGVTDLQCDLPSKMVAVTYRPDKTTVKKIVSAFEKIKMTAKEVPVQVEPTETKK